MKSNHWFLAVAVLVIAVVVAAPSCRKQDIPGESRADRVVMVSYDGMGADLAWQWINGGVAAEVDGLSGMVSGGFSVRRLRMVDPTLTAVNHWTLVTGKQPAETGIVNNTFHLPGTPITRRVSGFSVSSDVPALWTAAKSEGLRVGTLLWPGADAEAVDRMGDFGVVWPGGPLAASEVVVLDPAVAGTTGELISKDGVVPLTWSVEIPMEGADPDVVMLEIAAYDGDPDGRPRFDTVAARIGDEESWRLAGEREWFEIEFDVRGPNDLAPWTYALWSKPMYLDRFSGSIRLLRGAVWRLHGYPDGFTQGLVDVVGPWPGMPDERLLEAWWLDMDDGVDLDTFIEQAERLDRYLDRVARWVIANEEFQLLLAYHPTPDEAQHAMLIVHPDQWAYTPGIALAAREGLKRIGGSVDRSVADLWTALEPDRDVLVVVSDHGVMPITDEVRVNRVLAEAGLVDIEEVDGRRRVAATSPMVAIAHGASAQIYLNLEGREPDGVVRRAEAGEMLARAARALADVSVDGVPVVERIVKRSEAAELGLDHPNTGDLVVFFAPGFTSSWRHDGESVEASAYYGQHGYLASHNAMCGAFFARGSDVRVGSRDELAATDVAPLVASWLGFSFP